MILPRYSKSLGTSITEYLLPCLLVAVPVLLLTTQWQSSLLPSVEKHLAGDPLASEKGKSQLIPLGKNPYLKTVGIRLENGKNILLRDFPLQQGAYVDTMGASGDNEQLMAALESLARQLKDQGVIDEAEMNNLILLAKQGYHIAAAQRAIEKQAQLYGADKEGFAASTIEFEGKLYTPDQLANSVGFSGPGNSGTVPIGPKQLSFYHLAGTATGYDYASLNGGKIMAGTELNAFITRFQTAVEGDALQSDIAQQVVSSLVGQVINNSEAFENVVNTTVYNGAASGGTDPQTYTPEVFNSQLSKTIGQVTSSSHDICIVGQGQETPTQAGVDCTP